MSDARDPEAWVVHAAQQMCLPPFIATDFYPKKFMPFIKSEFINRLLDFGCGTGLWREVLRGPRYTGVDQNGAMIDGARKRWPNDEIIQISHAADAALPFEDEAFDAIVSIATLQHNRDTDKPYILRELRRVLVVGGRLLLLENTFGNWNPGIEDGYSHTAEGWKSLIEPAGFKTATQFQDVHVFRSVY